MNYKVGDLVRFKGTEQQYTLLGECGDFVWLHSEGNMPQAFLKEGLEAAPIIAPIYLRMYTDDGSFGNYTFESKAMAFDYSIDSKVIKVFIDESGNPKAEWVYE